MKELYTVEEVVILLDDFIKTWENGDRDVFATIEFFHFIDIVLDGKIDKSRISKSQAKLLKEKLGWLKVRVTYLG